MSVVAITKSATAPGTSTWARTMTASKIAAVVSASPWDSPRSLDLKMRGLIPWDDGMNAEAKSNGSFLEPAILNWWRAQHPEMTHGQGQPRFTRSDLPWAAATPDLASRTASGELVVVEAKTSRDDFEWGTPGTGEIPRYYEIQVMWQMHLSGARIAYVPMLTHNKFREYVVEYDEALALELERQAYEFWLNVQDPHGMPPLDDHVATLQAMKRLHPEINHNGIVEAPDDVAIPFMEALGDLKAAKARVNLTTSVALERMGNARILAYWGVKIARRQPNKYGVSFVPLVDGMPELPATITRSTTVPEAA